MLLGAYIAAEQLDDLLGVLVFGALVLFVWWIFVLLTEAYDLREK